MKERKNVSTKNITKSPYILRLLWFYS